MIEYLVIIISFLIAIPTVLIGLVGCFLLFLLGKITRSSLIKAYSFNLLYSIDQFGNALLLGDPDETISSRTGRAILSGAPKLLVIPFGFIIDRLAELFGDRNHIRKSVEENQSVDKELWKWHK